MRLSSIILALVGLGVAGGSAQMAREMLMAPQATAAVEAENAMVNVVTAAVEIRRGDVIARSVLRTQPWPRDAVPPGAIIDLSSLLPEEGGPPRRATRAMMAGELVLAAKVSEFGERVSLLQTLSPDSRAMAIRVDAITAVGGFVTPGDHIDILLTRTDREQMATDTILRNIRVLAVDQTSDERTDRPAIATTVTVEVTSDQGQILALSQRAGTLSLALRNPDAADTGAIDRLQLRDLLPELVAAPVPTPDPAPAPAAPAPEPTPAPVVVAAPPPPPVAPARSSILVRRAATSIEEVSVRTSDTDTGDTDAEDDADKTDDATDDETDETELVQ